MLCHFAVMRVDCQGRKLSVGLLSYAHTYLLQATDSSGLNGG